ncbi:uncharacterized protein HMPREF1541_03831 [Cyphellophora europaea CBS 101466]|uniref:Uncharacterized protein n=1 Tax=Cyphellophora europaea (strain CBS 101466) TaxID=1220924 RepID=W2RZQ0_CYPE1|nr:uncharacterized protein HMPREF1541_03831 [Cyphellophora europaea CBS 101466]ETN41892.1 hypothetical protein HMPREF1541_03831 [Cyphellophora europaea CBS 101466]
MTANIPPISPSRFALALQDLPLENLYAKAREIDNSIAHLRRSNAQLQEFSDSIRSDETISGETREEVGDRECLEAIRENEEVIERQRERVGLLKAEVERRGRTWHGDGEVNGEREAAEGGNAGRAAAAGTGGRLTDEELRRRMEEQMGRDDGDDGAGGGMHL